MNWRIYRAVSTLSEVKLGFEQVFDSDVNRRNCHAQYNNIHMYNNMVYTTTRSGHALMALMGKH